MNPKVYNPKDCVTTINDSYIISGYSSSMISGSKDNPLSSVAEGAQGDAIINVSCSRLGTMTITLQATSPSNAYLMKLAKERAIFSIWCANKTLGERMGGTQAILENHATIDNNDVAGDRVYTIKVVDFEIENTNE